MKINERKMRIIDTAHQLFVNKGFHTTSIQDIIEEAQISKGTFYNYFVSKNECLLAILEKVQAEGDQKRLELELGKNRNDEEIFIQQIAVRSNMNRKYSMLALFDAIAHLDDPGIKQFLRKQYQTEVKWTAKRISEIYTPETKKYSIDQAVMLVGMIHHFMHTWKMGNARDIEAEKVTRFLLKRLRPMIEEQLQTGDRFFSPGWFGNEIDSNKPKEIRSQLILKIEEMLPSVNEKQKKYLHFLKEEMLTDEPREFLIESIVLSLHHLFENTNTWHDIRQIIQLTKKYFDKKENGDGL